MHNMKDIVYSAHIIKYTYSHTHALSNAGIKERELAGRENFISVATHGNTESNGKQWRKVYINCANNNTIVRIVQMT